ncbi:hypothetical protein M433DRAFT_158347 [Acidomyces richmondensis BFW]|nr:MAG: hypothetical protein FE78DRAFT_75726 [Acidomyces sp. 'richmondensis']KYG42052.1 hypothetical protein M433DRAFT_158347 [Acidomyces richmondensis BFW]
MARLRSDRCWLIFLFFFWRFFTWPEGPFDDAMLPCSPELWKALIAAWHLPKFVLDGLVRFTGTAKLLCTPYGAEKPTNIGAASSLFYSKFAVHHDVKADLTVALVVMDEPTADELTDNADNSKDAAYIPTLIPLLVLEEEAQNALVKQLKFSDQISRTARRIGLNPWSKADKDDADHEKDLLSLSFDLTKVAQQIAQSKERCHNTARAIEKVREMHDRYLRLHEGQSSQTFDPATDEVNARLDIVMEMVKGLIRRAERCQEDIQANIQTIYSMVSSRDSRLNYQAADAARKLAEFTRRDSTDMRVISAVTLIFLPATFAATLFSTTFFDFAPRDPDSVVSDWIWLYWAVALGLTLVVLAGWVITSRMLSKWHPDSFLPILPGLDKGKSDNRSSSDASSDSNSAGGDGSDEEHTNHEANSANDGGGWRADGGASEKANPEMTKAIGESEEEPEVAEGKLSMVHTWAKSSGIEKTKTIEVDEQSSSPIAESPGSTSRPWQKFAEIRGLRKRKTDEIA